MRCPKPCWTPMDRDGERHVCPVCRTVITLHDPAYIPAPGYTPSPLRVPAPSPFKELPEEMGWAQESDALVLSIEETPREKAQRERREAEKARGVDHSAVTVRSWATRRSAA